VLFYPDYASSVTSNPASLVEPQDRKLYDSPSQSLIDRAVPRVSDSCDSQRIEETFFGHKFGYRHQFALITANSAKLRSRLDLGES
jgi:hypothetical protein